MNAITLQTLGAYILGTLPIAHGSPKCSRTITTSESTFFDYREERQLDFTIILGDYTDNIDLYNILVTDTLRLATICHESRKEQYKEFGVWIRLANTEELGCRLLLKRKGRKLQYEHPV